MKRYLYALIIVAFFILLWSWNQKKSVHSSESPRAPASSSSEQNKKAGATPSGEPKRSELKTGPSNNPSTKTTPLVELNRLWHCLQDVGICDLPNRDPREYSIYASRSLADFMDSINISTLSEKDQKEFYNFARKALHYSDGYIQNSSLKVLLMETPNAETLSSVQEEMEIISDPIVMDLAMDVLGRYLGSSFEASVHQKLADTLSNGAQFATERALGKILSFINETSLPIYEASLAKMSVQSAQAKSLKAAITEYRRMRGAG